VKQQNRANRARNPIAGWGPLISLAFSSPPRWREGRVSNHERIYDEVRRIPRGKVATYGQVAKTVGGCTARMVGYAMAALRGRTDVPWQRVINCKGEISPRAAGDGSLRQRKLLEREGVRFDSRGRVDLKKVRWKGAQRC
jgi:methylated-DNA-protein-cysteine methyltransferase-like protein